jgi:pilus assembly protein Flp/PilA
MRALNRFLNALMTDRRGATAVEYGLILALIFLAMAGSVKAVGSATSGMWNNVSAKIGTVVS